MLNQSAVCNRGHSIRLPGMTSNNIVVHVLLSAVAQHSAQHAVNGV